MKNWITPLQATLASVILIAVGAGCETTSRVLVDLSGSRLAGGHDPVIIDGKLTSANEWARAATAPLPVEGNLAVLWDERGLYGKVHGEFPPSRGMDECVSVVIEGLDQTNRHVRLYFARNGERLAAWTLCAAEPDELQVQHTIASMPGRSPFAWNAEFHVPWNLISGASGPPQLLQVHVFRLGSKHESPLLKLDSSAKSLK